MDGDTISVNCSTLTENAEGLITASNNFVVASSLSPDGSPSTISAKTNMNTNFSSSQTLISTIQTACSDKGQILKSFSDVLTEIDIKAGEIWRYLFDNIEN